MGWSGNKLPKFFWIVGEKKEGKVISLARKGGGGGGGGGSLLLGGRKKGKKKKRITFLCTAEKESRGARFSPKWRRQIPLNK